MKMKISLIASLIYFFIPLIVTSQNSIVERLAEVKTQKLVEKMELDEKISAEFSLKFKDFLLSIGELRKERRRTMKLLKDNVETQSEPDTLLSYLASIEDEIHNKRKNFMEDMSNILNPRQIARMIIYENKFDHELREKLKEIRKQRKRKKEERHN